ncbi:hypothetical protein [Bradyrhizobium commune]|uniref:IPT/TIG domain-containing protein n=1 Tax=Bradyrhizobium commune TaxID=83627 RepID=A0A7S9D4U8_9BRAD|nr:hypothetical protein [Bradyrhizobium commune]QPF91239.1 hypothetical protein IC761_33110 [Bradyrhizobium commune]
MLEAIKKFSGAILTCFGALVLVIILCAVFWLMTKLAPPGDGGSLPLLAIGGVVVLIFMLAAVAMVFSALGLSNRDLAMGLPEGSIRAVIALSLIVLFSILSIFLYQGVSRGNVVTIAEMSAAERTQFIKDHPNAVDLQSTATKGKDGAVKDGFFDVSYRSANPASDDFAKQLLVLLGTLMTAITSFYLGAGTVTSAVKTGNDAGAPAPAANGVQPDNHSIAAAGPLQITISGTNLNVITNVKITRLGSPPIVATNVMSNPGQVTCDLDVSQAAPGIWDIEMDDGGSKSVKLAGKLTLNP